ncbi:MAG TPA: GDSL-type esterase/lipase family protein [Chitinophagaceae bacterium]|nr:G-D-S-L family lipolytic protein [Chitinophagales bacterium]HPG10151.1 GDSL-type esterase/lipase family protein [Chitinophagaceae bacterium]HRX93052.1 GDSL-type esterase/lipase family protein [Chitinophagaceae bacterium]
MFRRIFLFVFTVITATTLQAQPFIGEIREFKKMDSISAPPEYSILFVGSSSFRMWADVADYFPSHHIINRGFGGSTLLDVIRYEKDIIFPYNPKQIVIYCGENDIAADSSVTGKIVYKRFKKLFHDIRKQFPHVRITYVSIKPSPSRWHLRNKMVDGNKRIEKFLARRKPSPPPHFINVWDAMLGPDGTPMKDIFIQDNLHMNKKGYAIWKKLIEPYLSK